MTDTDTLHRALEHAIDWLEGLDEAPVGATATAAELRTALATPLPEEGVDAAQVIDELARDARPGLMATPGGRFFGWVIGGAVPASVAADWLTSAWDQNAAGYAVSPGTAIIEEVCGGWLKSLLGLPDDASFAVVTGSQMAHVTALAAARNHLLGQHGWDVEQRGLHGAPPLRVLAGEHRHETVVRAARLLGLGRDAIETVPCDDESRIRIDALDSALAANPGTATIICLQAGDLNTGAFDPFPEVCSTAHAAGAWVHVDGAFGLWAAASPAHRGCLEGVEQADSWVTDGHKWLNVPYDAGYVFTAHPAAHRAAFAQAADYVIEVEGVRDAHDWGPEWSRRARALPTYAAIRSLGRSGIAAMVERCCRHAAQLVDAIGELPGTEVLWRPHINQGLVRFLADDGNHDARTDAVAQRIQADGTAWLGTTSWRGMRVLRVSVCSWRTSDEDVVRTVEAIRRIASET